MTKQKELLSLNKLQANEQGVLTIIHREDVGHAAPKLHEDHAVKITGTISAPRKFLEERGAEGMGEGQKAQQEVKRSNLQYSYRGLYIKFIGGENKESLAYKVEGTLAKNPDIDALKINAKSMMNSKDLSQHLRFNRAFFANREENLSLVQKLQEFKAKIESEIEKRYNDATGTKRDVHDIKVIREGEPLGFTAKLPLFTGQPDFEFKVEIMVDATGGNIQFWLESPDLTEALQKQAKAIIDKELEFFANKGYVLIEQ